MHTMRNLSFEPLICDNCLLGSYRSITRAQLAVLCKRPTSLHWLWNGIYAREVFGTTWKTILDNAIDLYSGKARMTASKATRAIAFAGNALMKQGRKPLQNPFTPSFRHTFWAASLHRGNFVTPSPRPFPIGSVMMRCLTTSDG